MENTYIENEQETKPLGEYISAFKRRRKLVLGTAGIVFLIMVLIAMLWPATYRSTATILIEQQQIPSELVPSTVTSYAIQQIEVIKQRIMTLQNILSIVDKFELYDEDDMARMARTEIAEKFQKGVALDVISADVLDPKTGRPGEATIAFNLSFDHKSPKLAQQVTNELTTLYLNENIRERTQQTVNATEFLEAGVKALNDELVRIESELAEFKKANEGSLPELYQYNLQVVERTERELMEISVRLQEVEKNKIRFASELAQLSPTAPVVLASGEAVLSDVDRLKTAQSEYRRKSSLYQPDHPDLARLKREIDDLLKNLGDVEGYKDRSKELLTARNQLAALQDRYTPDHPEVQKQQKVVEDLQEKLTNDITRDPDVIADNPSYVLLDTQLKSAEGEIVSLQERQKELRQKISNYEKLILRAPDVEKTYKALLREYETAQLRYNETKAKAMVAAVAQNLEEERKGERFSLIGPPDMPEEPIKPNRRVILFLGLVFAVAAGFGSLVVAETLDKSIRSIRALTSVTGVAPLVIIPYLPLDEEIVQQDKSRLYQIAAAVGAGLVVVLLIHFLYKPLDVILYIILRKLGLG